MMLMHWLKIFLTLIVSVYLVGCGSGGSGGSGSGEQVKTLVSIQVSPVDSRTLGASDLSITKGNEQQFEAIGKYSDGSIADITDSVTWHSSNTQAATISDKGLAKGVGVGEPTITAKKGAVISTGLVLKVTDAVLTGIQITPVNIRTLGVSNLSVAKGNKQQLEAMGIYSDGTTSDITDSVAWQSSDTQEASVSDKGVATGVGEGEPIITAEKKGVREVAF